jgi:hypothetical protein
MANDRAWYWLAAGVLALGLNGAYQDGEFAWAHKIADRSCSLLERVTERSDRVVAAAEIMLGHEPSTLARAQERLARLQEKLSSTQMDRTQRQLNSAQCKLSRARVKIVEMQGPEYASQVVVDVPNFPVMSTINERQFGHAVRIPAVRIPEVRIPEINIPQVRVPQITIPPVRVDVDNDDSDGLI